MKGWTPLLVAAGLLTSSQTFATRTLEWDDLVPSGWEPQQVYDGLVTRIYGDTPEQSLEDIADEDERALALMDALDAAWRAAPLKPEMNNLKVRLPGYLVPLDGDDDVIREFLLVPYFGACIHLPPPPRNQIVLVKMHNKGVPMDDIIHPLWVSGTLKVESSDTEYGTAGYVLEGTAHDIFKGP